MKTLYLECKMGASGDMLTGALLGLMPDPEYYVNQINALGVPHTHLTLEPAVQCGITGHHCAVRIHGHEEDDHHHDHDHHDHDHHDHDHHHHHHHHSSLADVRALLDTLPLSPRAAKMAAAAFTRIAEAESAVHGVPVPDIHFHEVGSLDAVMDVAAVCLLADALDVEQIIVSPIHVGSGTVRCAHGVLPVPAPATELLLRGVPWYTGSVEAELCTPTGAALLTTLADRFGSMPEMTVEKTGYGFGSRVLEQANCLRAFLGQTRQEPDAVYELRCNLDDMTGESLGYLREVLEQAGALDVSYVPVQMKKNRPGILLECLCRPADRERMRDLILRHSTTAGVRYSLWNRDVMEVSCTERETPAGTIREKRYSGFGITKTKPEYEDRAAIARKTGAAL